MPSVFRHTVCQEHIVNYKDQVALDQREYLSYKNNIENKSMLTPQMEKLSWQQPKFKSY